MPRNRITTELRADSTQLRSEFAKSSKRVGEFRKGISSTTKSLAAFAAGAIGIRAGVGVFSELADKFDRVGKLANRFDLPVEDVQKLSVAAELTGTNIEKLTAALTKSTVAGAEAKNGIKTYSDAFKTLGIDLDQFNGADSTQKIALLSRAFAEAEDETQAFTAAYRILGKAGSDLIPLLRENADGVERLTGSLTTLGADDIKNIEAFNDSMTLLKANLQAELGKAFAEDLDSVREGLASVGKGLIKTTAFILEHRDAIATLVKVWGAYKGITVTASILARVGALIKTTAVTAASAAAINTETAALARNTTAQLANTTAKRGGGAAGLLGRVLPPAAVAAAGLGIGKLFGDKIAEGIDARRLDEFERINQPVNEILRRTFDQVRASRSVADVDRVRLQISQDIERLQKRIAMATSEEEAASARHAINVLRIQALHADNVRLRNEQLQTEKDITTEHRAQAQTIEEQRRTREIIAAGRKATADREAARTQDTREQISAISQELRTKKFDLLPDASKLKIFERELAGVFRRAGAFGDLDRRLRGDSSLPSGAFDSESDLRARIAEAQLAGDEEGVLLLAKALKEVVELNEKIAAIKKERQDLARAEAEQAEALASLDADRLKSQEAVRKKQGQELAILKLRAAGRDAEADAMENEIRLRERAVQLAKDAGVTEKQALALLRQKEALRQKGDRVRDGRDIGLDSRFDADGNRRLAADGKRKKIVLIRRDRNGVRIDSRAQAAQRANRAPKPEIPVSKIDRLIELSSDQLKTWGRLQASS